MKGGLALLLLGGCLWMSIITVEYLTTGKPISQIPAIPQPVANIVQESPRFTSEVGDIRAPIGIAVAPDGTWYATESEGDRMIRAYSSSGTQVASFAAPDTGGVTHVPAYVAISPSGEVLVTDRGTSEIDRFSAKGEFLGTVPGPEGWHPLGLAFDATGSLYVTDVTPDHHRVVVLSPDYQVRGELGAGQLFFPNSLVVDGKGRVWVADSNNGRVVAFDLSGKIVSSISRSEAKSDLGMPRGMAYDNERKWLFVVDTTAHDVKIYDVSSSAPKFLYGLGDGENPAAGGFAFPNGIAFDNRGKLLVTDRANNRVQVWRY